MDEQGRCRGWRFSLAWIIILTGCGAFWVGAIYGIIWLCRLALGGG